MTRLVCSLTATNPVVAYDTATAPAIELRSHVTGKGIPEGTIVLALVDNVGAYLTNFATMTVETELTFTTFAEIGELTDENGNELGIAASTRDQRVHVVIRANDPADECDPIIELDLTRDQARSLRDLLGRAIHWIGR
jgi:beta-lactamase class A